MKRFSQLRYLVLLILLCSLTAVPVTAQETVPPGLDLAAAAGFDGYYKTQSWIPVHVTASNNGPAISGALQIATGSGSSRVLYTAPIDLPTQSSKQITLYVYLPVHVGRLTVELWDNGNRRLRVVQTNLLRPLEREGLLYGIVSSDSGRLAFLQDVTLGRSEAAVANLTLNQLPELTASLSPLNVLIFHDVDSGQLTVAQREALAEWIALGGQLVVSGGPSWQQTTAGLSDLLPVTVQGSRSVDSLPGLAAWADIPLRDPGPYVTAVASLRRGNVLLQDEELPLIVRHQIGRGAIHFLALDPTLAPLRDWDGNPFLWTAMLATLPRTPGWAAGFQRSYAALQAVQIIPGLSLPSIWFILLFMMGYVILIGPVNYLFLWRLKRRELAWLTIPAIIFVVSAGTYLAGTRLMGRGVIINQMSVAYGHVDSDTMQVHALTAIYSPRRTSYDLTMPGNVLARPFDQGFYGGSGIGQGGNVAAMERDAQLTARQTRIDVGGLQNFVAEFHQSRPAITGGANLTLNAGAVTLTVYLQNNSNETLEHGSVIYGDQVFPIGNLSPGASYEGSMTVTAARASGSTSGPSFGPYAYLSPAANLLSSNAEHLVGSSNFWNDRAIFARYQLLEALSTDYGGGGIGHVPTGVATLVGWSQGSELQLPLNPGVNQYNTFNNTFYFLELPVSQSINGGALVVGRALWNWRVLESEGVGDFVGITSIFLATGRIDYEFEPMVRPDNGQPGSLEIVIEPGAGSASQPPPYVSLWNWQENQWELVDIVVWGATPMPTHAPYVGPGDVVRLRVHNATPFSYHINEIYPIMGYE